MTISNRNLFKSCKYSEEMKTNEIKNENTKQEKRFITNQWYVPIVTGYFLSNSSFIQKQQNKEELLQKEKELQCKKKFCQYDRITKQNICKTKKELELYERCIRSMRL